jgi:hypothetical protein
MRFSGVPTWALQGGHVATLESRPPESPWRASWLRFSALGLGDLRRQLHFPVVWKDLIFRFF